MPMIDVYAKEGTFRDRKTLAKNLAAAVMRWEKVPELALFKDNTAAFVHDLPSDSISNVSGDSNYVRVQVLTPVGVLDRDKQLGVVKELTEIVAAAAGDVTLSDRTWVQIVESLSEVIDDLEDGFSQPFGWDLAAVVELEWKQHLESPPLAAHRSPCL